MPLPAYARELPEDLVFVQTEIDNVSTALAGLPGTPLEADLPDIVQIVADLSSAVANLKLIIDKVGTILGTTRINQ